MPALYLLLLQLVYIGSSDRYLDVHVCSLFEYYGCLSNKADYNISKILYIPRLLKRFMISIKLTN